MAGSVTATMMARATPSSGLRRPRTAHPGRQAQRFLVRLAKISPRPTSHVSLARINGLCCCAPTRVRARTHTCTNPPTSKTGTVHTTRGRHLGRIRRRWLRGATSSTGCKSLVAGIQLIASVMRYSIRVRPPAVFMMIRRRGLAGASFPLASQKISGIFTRRNTMASGMPRSV